MQLAYFESFEWETQSSTTIPYPKGLLPADYLSYAITDLRQGAEERCLINSVSNAKRALHLQVTLIAEALGMNVARNTCFPAMLAFCNACGVVGSRLLTNLNRLRNTVEHEYAAPTKEEAELFADVVELFLFGTRQLLNSFPSNMSLCAPDIYGNTVQDLGIVTESLQIDWEPGSGQIVLQADLLTANAEEIARVLADKEEANSHELARSNCADRQKREELLRTRCVDALKPYRRTEKQVISIRDGQAYKAWSHFVLRKAELTIS